MINWNHEDYEGIKWRWKYMMLKNGMLKHSVMTLNEKECDNIWGGNKYSSMNRWRTMLWHWMLMSKCDNTCCNAIEIVIVLNLNVLKWVEIVDASIRVWIWVFNEKEMNIKTLYDKIIWKYSRTLFVEIVECIQIW